MNGKVSYSKDFYIYYRLKYFNKILQNTGECITRKMINEEKIKY